MISYVYDSASYSYTYGNEEWLRESLATVGPVSVSFYASENFVQYSSGK